MIIIISKTSVQARFYSQKKEKEGIALLDVDVVDVSSIIEHFTCSCLYVICVCVAGRYCFRLIAAVVVDFSLLLFTHTLTHAAHFLFLYFIGKEK
jgi:hypothetical protein